MWFSRADWVVADETMGTWRGVSFESDMKVMKLHTVSLSSKRIFILAAACDCTASPVDTILVM